jgi:hypothetical protein
MPMSQTTIIRLAALHSQLKRDSRFLFHSQRYLVELRKL